MSRKELLLEDMRNSMAVRVAEYKEEGIWDSKEESGRESAEEKDITRGLKVYELFWERLMKRDWYPTADKIEGTEFYETMDELFTCTWYFYLQFEATFIMNLSEEGYEELVENDESYWADAVIEQLEDNYDFTKLVYLVCG